MECSTVPWRRLRSTTALSAGLELDAFRIKWGNVKVVKVCESVVLNRALCEVSDVWTEFTHYLRKDGVTGHVQRWQISDRSIQRRAPNDVTKNDKKIQRQNMNLQVMWQAEVQLVSGCHWVSFHIFSHFFQSLFQLVISTNHPQIIHKSSINHPKSSKIIQMSDRASYCSRFLPHQSSNPQRYGRPRTQWSTSTTGWPASNAIVGPETQLASPVALKLRSLSPSLYVYIYMIYMFIIVNI